MLKRYIAILVVGCLLALGPIWALLATIMGVLRSFEDVYDQGTSAQAALAHNVYVALWSAAAGALIYPLGLLLIALAFVMTSRAQGKEMSEEAPPP